MKKFCLGAVAGLFLAGVVAAQVCNVKVVTDASPDYHDMDSLVHSVTSKWPTPKEKCWAMFYWAHIARRQTQPMSLHGQNVTDPIRQFNDYGYMMCSTIAGAKCAIWHHMGLKVKFWDISAHTVPECFYDGRWHMYDDSMSAIYTLCDGVTIAGVEDIGKVGACAASGNKEEPGHIARYHCLNATSNNGWLTGADFEGRSVASEYRCFNPNGLKFRYYYNNWDWGHRYILNLRDREVYTRWYDRRDRNSPDATAQDDKGRYKADPAYFVPNHGKDPERGLNIRGNGEWSWTPKLTAADYKKTIVSEKNITALPGGGLRPTLPGVPAEAVFKVNGANVITSMKLKLGLLRKTPADAVTVAVSTTGGLKWEEVWKAEEAGDLNKTLKLIEPVNGVYEVLVKVSMTAAATPANVALKSLKVDTLTMLNAKTQPKLLLGKNTVYVGTGDQSDSIVLWPELQDGKYKEVAVDEKNMTSLKEHMGYRGVIFPQKGGEEGYVTFRIDAPRDITSITYGGRIFLRLKGAYASFQHSFDDGKTWFETYRHTEVEPVWDDIKYVTVGEVPAGTRSVLFKYAMNGQAAGNGHVSLYAVRMEANHKPVDPGYKPIEVTFTLDEVQEDYSRVERSHTHVIRQVPPLTYDIHVGGADHPVMKSLRVALEPAPGETRSGYSDGKVVGGEKFIYRWVTYGKNFLEGKSYTCTATPTGAWNANENEAGNKMTDGIVGADYCGGNCPSMGVGFTGKDPPVVTVDIGKPETLGVFRIHVTAGWPWWDALKGQVKDEVEVLTSLDGKQYTSHGKFDMNLRLKDVPINHMLPDNERGMGWNYILIPPKPVQARYVRYNVTPKRQMMITEVQALDFIRYKPFDMRIALPDEPRKPPVVSTRPTSMTQVIPGAGVNLQLPAGAPSRPGKTDASTAGKLIEERPTFKCLGVRWTIKGDANRNARIEVRYRKRGTAAWSRGLDLFRTLSDWRPDKKPAAGEWLFAGSVFDLDEGTDYELQLSLIDPDGGNAQKTLRMKTRTEPTLRRPVRTLHVVPGNGGGRGTAGNPIKGLAAADAMAGPGDLFLVHKGVYPATWTLQKSGSRDRPIVYRAAGDGEAVISGEHAEKRPGRGISLNGIRDVWFEGLAVRKTHFALVGHGADRIIIRRCHFYENDYGITATHHTDQTPQTDWLIADTRLEGPSTWPRTKGIENARGVQLNGLGHVVCYNTVKGFADGIDTFPGKDCSAIDFYGNEIEVMTDDGIEADYSQHNVRVFRNRMTNIFQGITTQPTFAGPVYIFRNVMYNVCVETFKMHNGPSGCLMFHNTSVKQGYPLVMWSSKAVTNVVYRNNMFIGTSGDWYCYENTAPLVDCDFDYDGYSTGQYKMFMKLNGNRYATPDDVRRKSGMYKNIVMLDSTRVFAKGDIRPKDKKIQHKIADGDMRLAPGSKAIDSGARLFNVNDDFKGKAPDLGAYELGQTVPHYGPRPQ